MCWRVTKGRFWAEELVDPGLSGLDRSCLTLEGLPSWRSMAPYINFKRDYNHSHCSYSNPRAEFWTYNFSFDTLRLILLSWVFYAIWSGK